MTDRAPSSFPPRVTMGYRPGSRQPFIIMAPRMDAENHTYLSEVEHEAAVREARAEAFEEAAERASEFFRKQIEPEAGVIFIRNWCAGMAAAAREEGERR